MKEYYKTLGLPTESSREEIKNARNNLLKKYHPDCYFGSADYAERKTIEINQAFEAVMVYLDQQEEIVRAKTHEKVKKEAKLQPKVGAKQKEKMSISEKKDKNVLSFCIYGLILLGVVILVLFFTGIF